MHICIVTRHTSRLIVKSCICSCSVGFDIRKSVVAGLTHIHVLNWIWFCRDASIRPKPVFYILLGVSSDYVQPITGQVTEVTCPVIGWAQPELTQSKIQKTGPGLIICWYFGVIKLSSWGLNKMTNIMLSTFQMPFLEKRNCYILIQILLQFIPESRFFISRRWIR